MDSLTLIAIVSLSIGSVIGVLFGHYLRTHKLKKEEPVKTEKGIRYTVEPGTTAYIVHSDGTKTPL